MEIEISKIYVKDNIRTRIDESNVSDLMADIKHKGLLQAIGVRKSEDKYELLYGSRRLSACKKLGYEKIEAKIFDTDLTKIQKIAINASENVHREDVSPYEFARVVNNLLTEGLNNMEVSVALSVPLTKVETALRIFDRVPEIEGIHTGYIPAGSAKKGLIAASVLDAIANLRISPVKTKKLMIAAHKDNMSVHDVRLVGRLMSSGMEIEEALLQKNNYLSKTATIVVRKEEYHAANIGVFSSYVREVMKGDRKPNTEMVY